MRYFQAKAVGLFVGLRFFAFFVLFFFVDFGVLLVRQARQNDQRQENEVLPLSQDVCTNNTIILLIL